MRIENKITLWGCVAAFILSTGFPGMIDDGSPLTPWHLMVAGGLLAGIVTWVGWNKALISLASKKGEWIVMLITVLAVALGACLSPLCLNTAAAHRLLNPLVPINAIAHLRGLCLSLDGAAAGGGLIWLFVELGKLMFGGATRKTSAQVNFSLELTPGEKEPVFVLAKDREDWNDIFFRTSDRVRLQCTQAAIPGQEFKDIVVDIYEHRVVVDGKIIPMTDLAWVRGKFTKITVPREAMGFGDVKLMAAIGAFLGWQGAIFSVFGSAIIGAVAALGFNMYLRARRRAIIERVPFGPFLALAAVLWAFFSHGLTAWYMLEFWK